MRDPYALIRELIFKYKGRPKEEVERAVLEAFKEAYGLYLPDLGVPYEELVHYIREGKEDEAYDWLEAYLYDYLLRRYEEELRAEEEKARAIGEKLLEALRRKRVRLLASPEEIEEYVLKILEDYANLQKKYKELQRKLASLKKKSASAEMEYEKGKRPLTYYLEIAQEVQKSTEKLREELDRLRKENEELKRLIEELKRQAPTPEASELAKTVEKLAEEQRKTLEDIRKLSEEVRRESEAYKSFEKMLPTISTDRLLELWERYEEEAKLRGIEPEKFKSLIERELKKRRWYFCPVHNVPLFEKTIAGVLYFICPVGGELWRLRDHKLVPVTPTELARLRKALTPPAPPTPPTPPPEEVTVEKPVRFEPLHYKYAKAMAPPEMKDLVDVFAMLSIDLEFGITRPEDFLDIDEMVKKARASAYYLYKTEPEEYERLKEKYKNALPPDLFKRIFEW